MLYTLRFLSSKCSLFHNANLFGFCIVLILYTGCAKIKKKNNFGAKRLRNRYIEMHGQQNVKIHTMSITLKVSSTPLGQWRIVMLRSALAEG